MPDIKNIRAGNIRAVARAISCIENDMENREALVDALYPHCGRARIFGITGPPGAGKSSLLNAILVRSTVKTAVIAVDPSSAFSGGALLGDRVRMQDHSTNPNIYIRSMASRGFVGGVAGATADAVRVLDAAGFEHIYIETVGVGQSEIEIAGLADLVLLVLTPGAGDDIQVLKAGVMEIGDIYVIHKCDKPEADKLEAQVEYVLKFDPDNKRKIIKTSIVENTGIEQLCNTAEKMFAHMAETGRLAKKRRRRLVRELERIFRLKMERSMKNNLNFSQHLTGWVEQLLTGREAPYALADRQISKFLQEK